MIRGIHGLLYSSDPDATRAFFRDKMKLPGGDIGGGWWIFDFREGDLGIHPVEDAADAGGHDVSFYCDDLEKVVAGLQSRGVTTDEIADHGYGLVTHLTVPGGIRVQLYQPKYTKGASRGRPKASAKTAKTAKKKAKVAKTKAKKAAPKRAARKKTRRTTR
jgi:catechol 2,3-dioxygenase-like lactoylglutathione lyase family enzyme